MQVSDFYPELGAHAPSTPQPLLKRYVLNAARQFCNEAFAWRYNAVGSVSDTTNTVELNDPLPGVLSLVHSVVLNGDQRLPAMNRVQQDVFVPDIKQPHVPIAYLHQGQNIYVVGSVGQEDSLSAWVSLLPLPTAETLDDSYALPFFDAIMVGATAQLYLHIDVNSTDKQGRTIYDRLMGQFKEKIELAKAHFEGNRVHRVVTTSYGGY